MKTLAMTGFFAYVAVLVLAGFTGLLGTHIELTQVFQLKFDDSDPILTHTLFNQYRFFKGLELCLGLFFLYVRKEVLMKPLYAWFFTAVVFTGALGRIISVLVDGVPHVIFTVLIFAELAIGAVFLLAAHKNLKLHEQPTSHRSR